RSDTVGGRARHVLERAGGRGARRGGRRGGAGGGQPRLRSPLRLCFHRVGGGTHRARDAGDAEGAAPPRSGGRNPRPRRRAAEDYASAPCEIVRMTISTHVLDTSLGRPAASMNVRLQRMEADAWVDVSRETTNSDGRVAALLPADSASPPGTYRLLFDGGVYLARRRSHAFHGTVTLQIN